MEYSLFGAWAETGERFSNMFEASPVPFEDSPQGARAAEVTAQQMAREEGGTLWVCRLFRGRQEPRDGYTVFTDPRDSRNADIEELELDTPDFLRDNPDWLVTGFAAPEGMTLLHPEFGHTAERHAEHVYAPSPLAAEDAARDMLRERGADFIVCSVLEGCPVAADTYATFADPDIKARA